MNYDRLQWLEKNNGVFIPYCEWLDGVKAEFLTHDDIANIEHILVYTYEDGYYADYRTAVVELVFRKYSENIGANHVRMLFYDPMSAMQTIVMMYEFECFYVGAIQIDLPQFIREPFVPDGPIKDDFEEFHCRIKHKPHFHPTNPETEDGYGLTESDYREFVTKKRQ